MEADLHADLSGVSSSRVLDGCDRDQLRSEMSVDCGESRQATVAILGEDGASTDEFAVRLAAWLASVAMNTEEAT